MKKAVLFSYSAFFILHFAFSQAPSPVACYNFSGNLNEVNGGTPLTTINGTGTYTRGLSLCTWFDPLATDSFYNWSIDEGLDLAIGTIFPKNHYTIELLFKFTSVPYPRSWQRIMDFKNNTSDLGLYTFDGGGTNYNLQMYTQNTGTTNTMAGPNTWMRLFLTRDSITGQMNGYLNDSLQISFIDAANAGVFISDLILFKDDIVVQGEESAGTIDYLRIFDRPLTRSEISYIVTYTEPTVHITGNTLLCAGDSTWLVATGATNYQWSNGATTDSILVADTASTFYTVTGWNYVFCTRSCKSTDTVTEIVIQCGGSLPHSSFISSDTSFCDETGRCIDFTDFSTGSPTSWQWLFPGATPDTSSVQNPTSICYTTPGTYSVTLITTNTTGTDTLIVPSLIIFATAPPPPIVTVSGDTLWSSHSDYYQWYLNGSPIGGAADSFYVANQTGTYSVRGTDAYECSELSNGVYVDITSAFSISKEKVVSIYPNPAKEEFTVYGLPFTDAATIEVYTMMGEKIFCFPLSGNYSKQVTVNCKSFPVGVYLLTISSERKQTVFKVIIQH